MEATRLFPCKPNEERKDPRKLGGPFFVVGEQTELRDGYPANKVIENGTALPHPPFHQHNKNLQGVRYAYHRHSEVVQ
jgi:hypothetical protein